MKIIDEKGRLFGKINVIDFLAILFLLCLTPMFYFGYKIYTRRTEKIDKSGEFIELKIACKLIRLKPETIKLIAVGDEEVDSHDHRIGRIMWIGEGGPYKYKIELSDNTEISLEDPVLKELPVILKLITQKVGSYLYYRNQAFRLDVPFIFQTNQYNAKVQLYDASQLSIIAGSE